MKRIFKGLILTLALLATTSCFKRDTMEGITIYTTVYPIEYMISRLYGQSSTVKSIYPNGIDVYNYELTEKQIKDYSKADLFIYNGLSEEKMIARKFLNENKNIKIIDVSYGLSIEHGKTPEELWLAPNNYLTLITTVKNNLKDLVSSKFINETIDKNYKELQEEVSIIDANIRSVAQSAQNKNKNTIVVTTDTLLFLNNYGFNVISIENDSNYTEELKNSYKNNKNMYIFTKENETSEKITELTTTYGAKVIEVKMMNVLAEDDSKNNDNYITIMNDFLKNLSDVTLSEK